MAGWDAATPLMNGWIGVDLFFVLSGFLISHHIMKRWGASFGRAGVRSYFTKRILRIVPTYYAVLLIVALGWIPAFEPVPDLMGLRVAYHMLFLQDYLPSNIVVAFWSLGVEEKFYLLAPLILIWVLHLERPASRYIAVTSLIFIPLLIRIVTLIANPGIDTYDGFFPVFRSPFQVCFDGLAAGMLCALLYRDRERLSWARNRRVAHGLFWSGFAVVGWLLGAAPLVDLGAGLFDKTLLQTVLALGMAGMLLGAAFGGGPGAFLRQRWLLFFSKISFSLYLIHLTLVPGLRLALDGTLGLDRYAPGVQAMIFLPVFVLASVLAALLLHYLVEKPFLLLKDRPRAAGVDATPARQETVQALR